MKDYRTSETRIAAMVESKECPKCGKYLELITIPSQQFDDGEKIISISPRKDYAACRKCGFGSDFKAYVNDSGGVKIELEFESKEGDN